MTLTISKTPARIKKERNDAVVAAGYTAFRKKFPAESNNSIFISMADDPQFPYNSPAGIRSSLLRSGAITL